MRFINTVRAFFVLMTLTLAGCASVDLTTSEQIETATNSENTAKVQLTSFELLALELKQQTNHYRQNQRSASAAAKSDFLAAIEFKRQGEIASAEKILTRLSAEHPKLSGPYLQRGDIYLLGEGEDKFERAEAQYRLALSVNQHNYHARNRLAQVLRQQGQFADAEEQYKKAIASWPAFKPAYLNLGILYDLYLGDKSKALEHYQTYQALNDKPERKVKGWIADLSRQVANQKTSQLAEVK